MKKSWKKFEEKKLKKVEKKSWQKVEKILKKFEKKLKKVEKKLKKSWKKIEKSWKKIKKKVEEKFKFFSQLFFSPHHPDQMSKGSQVSKVTLCVKILKWQSATQTPRSGIELPGQLNMSKVNYYQSAFNSQKEKVNILAEMLEISKSCIYDI